MTHRFPADVEEKLLRFARAGLAVASMKGKSYLSLGGVSMGIAGSIVDHNFFESWLGMKVQCGGYDRTASPYRSEDLRRSRIGNGTGLG